MPSLDGFTLHAATKAFALDVIGREALLRHVLRPPPARGPANKVLRLASVGESVNVPSRSKSRGPPYCKSKVLRQKALGDAA